MADLLKSANAKILARSTDNNTECESTLARRSAPLLSWFTSVWSWFGMSLDTASRVSDWANVALLGSLVGGVVSTFLIAGTATVKEGYWERDRIEARERVSAAEEHSARLAVELQNAKNDAKQIDANLLHEQRLTANERWRLERVEHAVLPRSNFVDWTKVAAELRVGKFSPINVAVPKSPIEARMFGENLAMVFKNAGLLKRMIDLPHSQSDLVPIISAGATMLRADDNADRLGQMLWQKFQLVGGSSDFNGLPPEWSVIPRDENCLVVLENNAAALAPGNGQAGESIDINGRPVPVP